MRIHITGASGSGTTTLGAALAQDIRSTGPVAASGQRPACHFFWAYSRMPLITDGLLVASFFFGGGSDGITDELV